MYILNTSFVVDAALHERWLAHLKKYLIPELTAAGYRVISLGRVLTTDSRTDFTYSLIVSIPDIAAWEQYCSSVFAEYAEVASPLFGESLLWLHTLIKVIKDE